MRVPKQGIGVRWTADVNLLPWRRVPDGELTALLSRASAGDRAAANTIAPIVYDELRRRASALMRSEARAQTLQVTGLVHEAFMQLLDAPGLDIRSRAHFFALASRVMRRILVDQARLRAAQKRPPPRAQLSLD
jgi:RNA polymerase sigma-70 factor (ECF subfamily)